MKPTQPRNINNFITIITHRYIEFDKQSMWTKIIVLLFLIFLKNMNIQTTYIALIFVVVMIYAFNDYQNCSPSILYRCTCILWTNSICLMMLYIILEWMGVKNNKKTKSYKMQNANKKIYINNKKSKIKFKKL